MYCLSLVIHLDSVSACDIDLSHSSSLAGTLIRYFFSLSYIITVCVGSNIAHLGAASRFLWRCSEIYIYLHGDSCLFFLSDISHLSSQRRP